MDVTMPQLGETVTEGTITRWFKQVGDKVDADEPLFEVSTDKVDSEVPAPQAGYLSEIVVPEGDIGFWTNWYAATSWVRQNRCSSRQLPTTAFSMVAWSLLQR